MLDVLRNLKHSRNEWCLCPNVVVLENGGIRSSNIALLFSSELGSVSVHVRQCTQNTRSAYKVYSILVAVFLDTTGISWPSFFTGRYSFLSLSCHPPNGGRLFL